MFKIFLSFIFLFSFNAFASLKDVSYTFGADRVKEIENPFFFLRSFVDYFYILTKENEDSLSSIKNLKTMNAWCVGDAHPENFGTILLSDHSAVFTENDVDDSGPCPAVYDLMRFFVSSKLYDSKIDLEKIYESYLVGLDSKGKSVPSPIQKLLKKAPKKGVEPQFGKTFGKKFRRSSLMTETSDEEKNEIKKKLPYNILDIVSLTKEVGGSAGMLRYEVLTEVDKKLIHLELKEQKDPAVSKVASEKVETQKRLLKSLELAQGKNFSKFYSSIQVKDKIMLIRPRFAGNMAFELKDNGFEDNKEIIEYEAYLLGTIHSRSLEDKGLWKKMLKDFDFKVMEENANLLADKFNLVFSFEKRKAP